MDDDAHVFSARYLDPDGAGCVADESLPGTSDEYGAGAAQAASAHMRGAAQAASATGAAAPLAAVLGTEIVHALAVIERDGRPAIRMDLRHAKLPRTSVSLENLPGRLQVTFESADPEAMALLAREIPHLAASLAERRQCDCSVLVNTAPPGSRTRYRSDAERPKVEAETEGLAIGPRMA
ncbi:type III secretion HpaP family protein [Achromobacter aloeverae]|uniref:type III secretion HpaP family protein n=1 Tax=Achromobacter aloeverae TaxID=1750518 RepID=UPI0013015696|nr:type III secretion HpaP family protein [Achromobacter aloeverae]